VYKNFCRQEKSVEHKKNWGALTSLNDAAYRNLILWADSIIPKTGITGGRL